MRKIAGKRYCKGKAPGFVLTSSKRSAPAMTAPKGEIIPLGVCQAMRRGMVMGVDKHRTTGVDMVVAMHKLGRTLWEPIRQMPRMLHDLCMVARSGTLRGRYIRVTAVQAEMVLGIVIVLGLTTVMIVVPAILRWLYLI